MGSFAKEKKEMEVINSLIDFFGLAPDIVTFTDLLVWFCKMILGVVIVSVCIKGYFKMVWKVERISR